MAVKKYKCIIVKPFNKGVKKDGSFKHAYKKGDVVRLTKKQIITYKNNNLI